MKKRKSPKNDLMWPSKFEADGLHLNSLKKTQIFKSNSFIIHITYYGKSFQLSKSYGMTEMIRKQKNSKVSLAAPG
jgi:hypothetical protein